MLSLVLPPARGGPLQLLCLGAHADDIEIGCGGTILRLAAEAPDLVVRWIVFSGAGLREAEARNSAAAFLENVSEKQIEVLAFRDGYFPFQGADIKDCFENVKHDFNPSLILTHWQGDAHQDHRLLAELTHNTFRDHLVLEYEIPKYDGNLGNPAFFRTSDARTSRTHGGDDQPSFHQPARTKLVFRRDLSRDGPVARHRVQFPPRAGRGVLRQKDRTLMAIAMPREVRISGELGDQHLNAGQLRSRSLITVTGSGQAIPNAASS